MCVNGLGDLEIAPETFILALRSAARIRAWDEIEVILKMMQVCNMICVCIILLYMCMLYNMCVCCIICVCTSMFYNMFMCVLSSHLLWTSDLWTHQPGSHRRKVTQEEGHTGFLHLPSAVLASIFIARRIQHPFPSSTVKTNFVYPRNNRSPLVKIPVCVTTSRFELTSQRQKVSRLPTEPPGRPAEL